MFPLPDARGRYGIYGGRYVPETLIPALDELAEAYRDASADPAFRDAFAERLATYVGRPSRLTLAQNLTGVDVIVGGDSHSLLGDDTFATLGFNPVGEYPTVTAEAPLTTETRSSYCEKSR